MEEKNTLALEMMRELKANSKRWFISFLVVLVLWFTTIGIFIWYINQPVEETETITTQNATLSVNDGIMKKQKAYKDKEE